MTGRYDDVCQMAKNLARNCGYAVVPVRANKMPATPSIPDKPNEGGFHFATKDLAGIDALWRDHPGPLIGIRCGAVSDLGVVDIDAKHATAVAWWGAALPLIGPTRIYKTRSGGWHAYFRHAPGVTCNQNKLAYGVDVRAEGGYVVSWFAAGFECLDDSPPAPWPDWLLRCVLWQPPPPPMPDIRISAAHAGAAVDGVLRVVSSAREGNRNSALFWGACRMRDRISAGHISRNEASSLLVNAAHAAGISAVEARRSIASAWKAA